MKKNKVKQYEIVFVRIKTMVKKKNKTRTCGKCKTAFPVGRGHNARTCGRGRKSFKQETAKLSPQKKQQLSRGTKTTQMMPLTIKKKVPRSLFLACSHEGGRIFVILRNQKQLYGLPREWLHKYNFIKEGRQELWFNEKGQPHRLDGPAVRQKNGNKEWWVNGERHRLDGPAVEHLGGTKEWWVNGERHRLDGPAVERADGHKTWWLDGQLHRLDGPAVEYANGGKEWWVNRKQHRLDGPAVVYVNGTKEWWVNDCPMEDYADLPEIPEMMGEYFYFLCINENPHVRKRALANPNCPLEWRVAGQLIRK